MLWLVPLYALAAWATVQVPSTPRDILGRRAVSIAVVVLVAVVGSVDLVRAVHATPENQRLSEQWHAARTGAPVTYLAGVDPLESANTFYLPCDPPYDWGSEVWYLREVLHRGSGLSDAAEGGAFRWRAGHGSCAERDAKLHPESPGTIVPQASQAIRIRSILIRRTRTEITKVTHVRSPRSFWSSRRTRTVRIRRSSSRVTSRDVRDGGAISKDVEPGSYSTRELVPNGWDLESISCQDPTGDSSGDKRLQTATFNVAIQETVICTFTNTKRGDAKVVKTVNGRVPLGSESFGFELRQGASTTMSGNVLEPRTANAANGGMIDFAEKLVPGAPYALCEIVMPGWMTTLGPPFYAVYNPSGDNSTVCTDFTVTPGQTKSFAIDNKPPPGDLGRTIGFWKNWASCTTSNGKQKPVLDNTLVAAGQAGITIGTLTLRSTDCLKAVRLLDKSTIDTGKKMASDPAFNLAAQLLAAKLNVVAGAGTCPAAVNTVNGAQTLLAGVHFTGITHDKLSAAQTTQANTSATTLDRYNNQLC